MGRRLERTVALAQQDAHVMTALVRNSKVWFSVSVEVSGSKCNRSGTHSKIHRILKSAVANADQHADRVAVSVGDGQIRQETLKRCLEASSTSRALIDAIEKQEPGL